MRVTTCRSSAGSAIPAARGRRAHPTPVRPVGERGSALALVPAGFLVLLVLAAIAVDSAAAFLAQRQLGDALSSAANDAATVGLDRGAFYASGRVVLDPAAVRVAVCRDLAAQGQRVLALAVGVAGAEVELRASARIRPVFGAALPGGRSTTVAASATAVASTAPQPVPTVQPALQPVTC